MEGRITLRILTGLVASVLLLGCPKQNSAVRPGPAIGQVVGGTEEVTFPAEDIQLEGLLHLPDRFGPVPGIVLIHGSGPQSRHVALPLVFPGVPPVTVHTFDDLAKALVEAGFAVLRYDKRACGSFNGRCENSYPTPAPDLLVSDFMADASAALDFLGAHSEVDDQHLAVVGHSQGATFVPLLMAERPKVKAGVLLAGGYRSIELLLADQTEGQIQMMLQLGLTQEVAEAQVAPLTLLSRDLGALRAGTYSETEGTLDANQQAFWTEWMDLCARAPEAAKTLDRPLLSLGGTYDFNVPPAETEAWAVLLDAVDPNPGHRSRVIDCLTHGLNCVSEPDWTKVGPEHIDDAVSPELLEEVKGFLTENLRR